MRTTPTHNHDLTPSDLRHGFVLFPRLDCQACIAEHHAWKAAS